jgi:CheY-like chemotaxis protein
MNLRNASQPIFPPCDILVADDEEAVSGLLALMLQGAGCRVATVGDGRRALVYLEEHRPRMLFVDLMMPGFDGLEVIRRIRQDPRLERLPVVLISGMEVPSIRREAEQLGVRCFLRKPFDLHTIERLAAEAMAPDAQPVA